MTQILEIDTNTPWWKQDLDRAIVNFEADYEVKPIIIIGKNVMEALMENVTFYSKPIDLSEDISAVYQGTPCEYDPDISCVILKA